ncbi:MAG TPA: sodium-translocating pyrophosphatase, partial [Chromatiales bacterium]|nr:sodium-translocating pyrophosphatase [Chromatiales bacterium]
MTDGLLFAILAALAAIVYGMISIVRILGMPDGNEDMQRISAAIQEGASAYLKRQYLAIGLVGVIVTVALLLALDIYTAVGFVIGAVFSGLTGFIGMNVSVRSNARTAEAARHGLNAGLAVAFRGGAITGLLVVGLALLG